MMETARVNQLTETVIFHGVLLPLYIVSLGILWARPLRPADFNVDGASPLFELNKALNSC